MPDAAAAPDAGALWLLASTLLSLLVVPLLLLLLLIALAVAIGAADHYVRTHPGLDEDRLALLRDRLARLFMWRDAVRGSAAKDDLDGGGGDGGGDAAAKAPAPKPGRCCARARATLGVAPPALRALAALLLALQLWGARAAALRALGALVPFVQVAAVAALRRCGWGGGNGGGGGEGVGSESGAADGNPRTASPFSATVAGLQLALVAASLLLASAFVRSLRDDAPALPPSSPEVDDESGSGSGGLTARQRLLSAARGLGAQAAVAAQIVSSLFSASRAQRQQDQRPGPRGELDSERADDAAEREAVTLARRTLGGPTSPVPPPPPPRPPPLPRASPLLAVPALDQSQLAARSRLQLPPPLLSPLPVPSGDPALDELRLHAAEQRRAEQAERRRDVLLRAMGEHAHAQARVVAPAARELLAALGAAGAIADARAERARIR